MTRHLTVLMALLMLTARAATAQSTDERTSAITHELMSPFCPELLLAYCPSDQARVLREEIERRVAAGESVHAIEDDLAARYGEQIRSIPPFHGVGVLAWIGPPLAGTLGLAVVVIALRAATRNAGSRDDEPDKSLEDHALSERLRDELEDLD